MKIKKIEVENFRLLKDFSIDLEDELSLVIGKNNTGKTSILTILDKFLNEKTKFSYDDFNIDFKNELEGLILSAETPPDFLDKGVKLKLFIEYNEADDLSNVSRVLMDLDPDNNIIVLGFEHKINYDDFLKIRREFKIFSVNEIAKNAKKKEYKPRELKDFLKQELDKYFRTHKMSFEYNISNDTVNEMNFINLDKEGIAIKDIISFKYISARRDVTNKEKENTLSKQTSSLYKKEEDSNDKTQATEDFKDQLSETDSTLSDIYKNLFKGVIKKVQDFGGTQRYGNRYNINSTAQRIVGREYHGCLYAR